VLTSDFSHYEFPFTKFNKVQSKVIPLVEGDCNIVVSSSTATGKTAIASASFGYHLGYSDSSKVVYLSPYKGLSMERYDDWRSSCIGKYGVLISTGDYYRYVDEIDSNRVLLFTYESFLSKCRNRMNHGWINDVSCVVLDEVHLIGSEDRGHIIESMLMTFTGINQKSRLITLSATMSNSVDFAKWLKMLNSKPTRYVNSTWRPVELQKIVVFVHSKITGKKIVAKLNHNGIVSVFHNASLSKEKRLLIEEKFRDPKSGLDVLVSTSTLAAGVNL